MARAASVRARATSAAPFYALTILAAACAEEGGQARVQAVPIESAALEPAPINPEWIIAGTPVARAKNLTLTADKNFSSTVWDCTAGSFRWHFGSDEVVHILDGEVTVETGDGGTRLLKPGDVALFPKGLVSIWVVHKYVKKLALHRTAPPGLPRRVANSVRDLF
jgi:uncharacterized protein